MFTSEQLYRFAQVIARQGMGVSPGQTVNVSGYVEHIELMRQIIEAAYEAGAQYAQIEVLDRVSERTHYLRAPDSGIEYIPRHFGERLAELTEVDGCQVRLVSMEAPDFWQGVDQKRVARVAQLKREARKVFYDEGIGQSKVQWCVAPGATPEWAQYLYPDLSIEEATDRLWNVLASLIRSDQPDFIKAWSEHAAQLKKRREKLDSLALRKLHFRGEGTDLLVSLSSMSMVERRSEEGCQR